MYFHLGYIKINFFRKAKKIPVFRIVQIWQLTVKNISLYTKEHNVYFENR